MHIFLYICVFLVFTVSVLDGRRVRRISKREEEALEKAHRNAICCAKKMRCCMPPKPPPIEIRAILARCPNLGNDKTSVITRTMNKPLIAANEHSLRHFQGFDEDEPLIQSRVTKCRRKILMTLKMHHKGAVNSKNQYIVVDHVYDPVTEKSVRLLNPYVIKLKQQPVNKAFYLKFIDYVNSEAKEQIYNKQDANYTGCYTDKLHATCGIVKYEGKVIPYSEGFCCSCDLQKNLERQPASVSNKNEPIVSYSDPAYLLDRVQCPRTFYKDKDYDPEMSEKPEHNKRSHETTSMSQILQFPSVTTGIPQFLTNSTPSTTTKRWQYTTYSRRALDQTTTENSHKYLLEPLKMKRNDWESLSVDKSLPRLENTQPVQYLKHLQIADRKKHPSEYILDVKKAHVPQPMPTLQEESQGERLLRKIRQTYPSGVQKRGGQNCANRYTPPGLDPEHYHESTHCLRFSDVWYGIYKLGRPYIEQTVELNIYERFETESNPDKWREITNSTVHLGDKNPLYEDEIPTISITLMTKSLSDKGSYDNLHTKRILIPEGVSSCDAHKYPEMRNGADEYLVVKPDDIDIEGDQCDKIGVGFEAFYKQPDRCGLPRGTCLHNQPKNLWKHDKSLEKKNETGCYFLKYHANITGDPIIITPTGDKFLKVEYNGAYTTTVDIEIKADFNTIIRQQTTAAITEVYIDSTCDKITTIIAKVINSGLISCQYMVQLSDFPLDISENMTHIKTPLSLISPQNQYIFTMQIRTPLPSEWFHCSVEVLNTNKELVALRRIRIQKYDRCICSWHCLCACVASSQGLKCIPMAIEHYHAAGFQGSLPIVTHVVHFTLLDDLLSVTFYFALFLLGTLLVLGLSKALLGMCCYTIGIWGLAVLLDLPKRMKHYYEKDINKENVIYDDEGWPVHPNSKTRVRNISVSTQFCTNLVFFFTYPLACCLVIFRRLCCPYYTRRRKEPEKRLRISEDPTHKKYDDRKRRFFSTRDDTTNTDTDTKTKSTDASKRQPQKSDSKADSAPRKRFSLTGIVNKSISSKAENAPRKKSSSPRKTYPDSSSSSSAKSKKSKYKCMSRKKPKDKLSSSSDGSSKKKCHKSHKKTRSKSGPVKYQQTTTTMYVEEHRHDLPKICSCTHPKLDDRSAKQIQHKSKFSRVDSHFESADSNRSHDRHSFGDTVIIKKKEKISRKSRGKCTPRKTESYVSKQIYKVKSDTRIPKSICASECAKDETHIPQPMTSRLLRNEMSSPTDSLHSSIIAQRKSTCSNKLHDSYSFEEIVPPETRELSESEESIPGSISSENSSSEDKTTESSSYCSSDSKKKHHTKNKKKCNSSCRSKSTDISKSKSTRKKRSSSCSKKKKTPERKCPSPKKKTSSMTIQRGNIFKRFSKSRRSRDKNKECEDTCIKNEDAIKSKISRNSISKFLSIRKRSQEPKPSQSSFIETQSKPIAGIMSMVSIPGSEDASFEEIQIQNLDDLSCAGVIYKEEEETKPKGTCKKSACHSKSGNRAKVKAKSDKKVGYCSKSPRKNETPPYEIVVPCPQMGECGEETGPIFRSYIEEKRIIRVSEKDDAKCAKPKGSSCYTKSQSNECNSMDTCPAKSPQKGILSKRHYAIEPVQIYTSTIENKDEAKTRTISGKKMPSSTGSSGYYRTANLNIPTATTSQERPGRMSISPRKTSIPRPKSM